MNTKKTLYPKDAATIQTEFQDYAYKVSHDLNSPVRAMVEFSKLLAQEHTEKLDTTAKEYLALIIESGQKMQMMMEGLLQYSRLNTIDNKCVPVDIGRVVQQVLLLEEDLIKKSGAKLVVEVLPTLCVDLEQIPLVFHALIDNAIKFQPVDNEPSITVSAEKKEDCWQFAIADNGIGIQQQFQDKIFKLFDRLHPDDQYSGVGIGLTLAQKVIHRHNGEIWFESTIGKGCTFYFTLPLD